MTPYSDPDFEESPLPPQPERSFIPIPLHQTFLTYIFLGLIIVIWLIMELLAGGSTNSLVLVRFGANFGPLIIDGQVWRLFTSMFLHIGLMHLVFNAYALFIFGLEMERLYGPDRYLVIYVLSGLFGSLLSFATRGPNVLSAGASGAIFGIIGMNLAFFLIHRDSFGEFGRSRLSSTLFIIGLNLFFGFTVPGIDNYAHIGGLIAGFALGYGLAPSYQLVDQYTGAPRLIDTVTWLNRGWVAVLAILLLSFAVPASIVFWS
ncbi:MAG: rhomboid family intramembrane serine protease [Chloroflexota bacterium]